MSVINPVISRNGGYSLELQEASQVPAGLVTKINDEWKAQKEQISAQMAAVKSATPGPLKLSFLQKIFAFFSKDFEAKLAQNHKDAHETSQKTQLKGLSEQQAAAEAKMKHQMTQINNTFGRVLNQFNQNKADGEKVAADLGVATAEVADLQGQISAFGNVLQALGAEDNARAELSIKERDAQEAFGNAKANLEQKQVPVHKHREQLAKRAVAEKALAELTKGRREQIDTLIHVYRNEIESDVNWSDETSEAYLVRRQEFVTASLDEAYGEKKQLEEKKLGFFTSSATLAAHQKALDAVDGMINTYSDELDRLNALAEGVKVLNEKTAEELDLEKTIQENQGNRLIFTYEYNLEQAQVAHSAASRALETVSAQLAVAQARRDGVMSERKVATEAQDELEGQLNVKRREVRRLENRQSELSSIETLADLVKKAMVNIAL